MTVTKQDVQKAIINAYNAMGGLVWVYTHSESPLVQKEIETKITALEDAISTLETLRGEMEWKGDGDVLKGQGTNTQVEN